MAFYTGMCFFGLWDCYRIFSGLASDIQFSQKNMLPTKIHILGAPGSGVTSLGRELARDLSCTHFDTDDYHWFTDDALPYRRRRNPDHRRALLTQDLDAHSEGWVLSGALCGWGDAFIPRFDTVVYCWAPVEIRLARIQAREQARFGADRVGPGGDLHTVYEKFCAWAAAYDEPSDNIRSRDRELAWLKQLSCPTFKLETQGKMADLQTKIVHFLTFQANP